MISYKFNTLFWILFFAFAALGLYVVKYQVQEIRNDDAVLEASLKKEQHSLALLQAEWSYLNRAERLQQLADRYLQMKSPAPVIASGWQDVPTATAVTPVSHTEKR